MVITRSCSCDIALLILLIYQFILLWLTFIIYLCHQYYFFCNNNALLSQHVVFVVKFFVAWLIPDVPSEVKARVKRERYLIQEYLHDYELEKLKVQLSQNGQNIDQCTCPTTASSPMNVEVVSDCLT